MSEPVFFRRGDGLTLGEIASLTNAQFDPAVRERRVFNVAALERAGPNDLSFASRKIDASLLSATRAGACFVTAELAGGVPPKVAVLIVADPYKSFLNVVEALFPQAALPSSLFEMHGHAESALVHPQARLEAGVTIDPAAVIGPRAEIGSGTVIGPLVVVGPDVRIGRDCALGAGASVTHALIGDRVVIHAGCRVGEGGSQEGLAGKTPRVGRVIVQDGVELGANSTIDRGSYGDTVIGEGARIANLAHVAADMMLDRYCVILAGAEPRIAPKAESR
jgi:UDP-3-O-[3-hydroxymyristoyl] glucosamine N-acyltransferase